MIPPPRADEISVKMLCLTPPVVRGRKVLAANVDIKIVDSQRRKKNQGSDRVLMAIDGRIVLGILATPFIYSTLKSAYWSGQMKKLNDREVLSERYVQLSFLSSNTRRFSWLYKCMLDDEFEKVVLAKNEKVEPLIIGGSNVSA
jgi:hypothetical protein